MNRGSAFDDFLRDEGIYDASHETAIKRVLAWQIGRLMEEQDLSKKAMAERMGTSRSALDRLLDPDNEGVTLATLKKAAHATGQCVEVRLVAEIGGDADGTSAPR